MKIISLLDIIIFETNDMCCCDGVGVGVVWLSVKTHTETIKTHTVSVSHDKKPTCDVRKDVKSRDTHIPGVHVTNM